MKQLVHGGDWMGYRERFGRDALDFSANVSPLGLPEGVAQAIREALTEADRYPDPLCRTLCAALSRAEGVPRSRSSAATARRTSSSGWSGPQSPAGRL